MLLWVICVALVAGAFAGWMAARAVVQTPVAPVASSPSTPPKTAPTSTTPAVEIVPVVRRSAGALVFPSTFTARRISPVIALAKKGSGGEESVVTEEQEVGRAVAMTNDGWIVTPLSALRGLRVADLVALWKGRAYPIKKAIRDTTTDAVFLKTDIADLPTVAFVASTDFESGLAVFVEPDASRIYPEALVDERLPAINDLVSSERAIRRLIVSGQAGGRGVGGAVWDERGQLVGLLESWRANGWSVLPANDLDAALASLLANGEIRHAALQIRGTDLSRVTFERTTKNLPVLGFWLRATVSANGPAAKLLRDGDVIERVERDVLDGTADLGERLLDYRPGTQVSLSGSRNGQPFTVTATLGSVVTSETIK